MANEKFNGQNNGQFNGGQHNGQQPQVRVDAPNASKNNFLKSFLTSKAGKITGAVVGVAALATGGYFTYRHFKAKKVAAAEQAPAAPATEEPAKK